MLNWREYNNLAILCVFNCFQLLSASYKQTETLLNMIKKYNIPIVFYIYLDR